MLSFRQLFLVATMLVAAATTAECFILDGVEIAQIRILGVVECISPPPPPPPGTRPILNGTNVGLVCAGSNKSLTQTVANPDGTYELVYNTTDSVLFDPSTCFVTVRLPIVRCRIYPPTGFLRATLIVVGLLQPLFYPIAIITAGPLELVAPNN